MRAFLPLLLLGLAACGEEEAPPVPEAEPVVVELTNNSEQAWTDMAVVVDGSPACNVEELAPTGSITVQDGKCEVFMPEPEVEPEPEVPTVSTKKKTQAKLSGKASITGGIGPARVVRIANHDKFDWTGCSFALDGKWRHRIAKVPHGSSDATPLSKFKDSDGGMMTRTVNIRTVSASCNEGKASFPVQ